MARPTTDRPRRGKPRKRILLPEPISYLDIQTLSQFLTERGKIRARTQTGLSRRQQREVAQAIKRARELALLPYVRRDAPEPRRRGRGPA